MAQPLKPTIQQDLSRGMNAVTNPFDVGQQQSISLVNVLLDEHGSIRTRDGTALQTVSPDMEPAIRPIIKLFDFVLDATGGSSGQGGGGGGGGGGGAGPVVTITAPINGAVVSPGVITVSATVHPAAGLTITNVKFFINQGLFATLTVAPYTTTFDLSAFPDGTPVTFSATALDSAGNISAGAEVGIVVA